METVQEGRNFPIPIQSSLASYYFSFLKIKLKPRMDNSPLLKGKWDIIIYEDLAHK